MRRTRALSARSRDQSRLFVADHAGQVGLDAWLRVVDFAIINPELGGEDGFRQLARGAARSRASASSSTSCPITWRSAAATILTGSTCWRKAATALYADFFDVDFNAPGLAGKILVPFLGVSYAEALNDGRTRAEATRTTSRTSFAVYYHDHCFPIRDVDRLTIRAKGLEEMNKPERLHALLEAQHYRLAQLAHRQRSAQLPPLLRDHHAGGRAHRAAGRVRQGASRSATALRRRPD